MKRLFAALAILVATVGLSLLSTSPASAHTPAFSADCNGVHVQASAYDAGLQNRWSVTIGGTTQNGTFGASFDQTFPVPQNGATTTWSASIEAEDGSFHGQDAGTVGPCGTPADECVDLPGTQPVGTSCTPPPDVTRADSKSLQGCDVTFGGTSYGAGELTYDEQYVDTYVFNEQTNTWDLVTDTTPTVANIDFTPWSVQQQVAHGCTDAPNQPPAEHSSHSSNQVDCDSDTVVTTTVTTTTPYVYDDTSNSWVPGTPESDTTTTESPVQPGVCRDVDASHTHTHNAGHSSSPVTPASSAQVPTMIDAGLGGVAPAAATTAAPADGNRLPALVLVTAGAALLLGAGLRLRRS